MIVCLSASYFAKGIAKLLNKIYKPQIKINPKSWFSNDSISYLQSSWDKTKRTDKYIEEVLNNVSGNDGNKKNKFKNIDWQNVDWIDENKWEKIQWDNNKYKNIHTKLKDKNSIVSLIKELIEDKTITDKDRKKLLQITEVRLTNTLKSDKVQAKNLSSSMHNMLRDMVDLGKDVFMK